MTKAQIMELAEAKDFSQRTVQRAKKELGIEYRFEGFGGNKKSIWFISPSNLAK